MIQQYALTVPEYLIKNIYDLKSVSTPNLRSNVAGWQSEQYTSFDNIPWAEELFNECLKTANLKNPLEHVWFNMNPPGSFNKWHSHTNTTVVCVLYVQVPSNSGNIEFRGQFTESITPSVGLFLVFPGGVDHQVVMNRSSQDRISMAFNLGPLT